MKIKDIKIGTLLMIGFAGTLVFVVVLGAVAYLQSDQLYQQTETMFNHPLQVGKAVGSINADVLNMRLGNRDLMLATTEKEHQAALQLMAISVHDADQQFTILEKTYLGPLSDVEEAHRAFINWRTAREENTKLALLGQDQKVKESVLSTGSVGILRDKMLAKIKVIDDYSANKANELNLYSERLNTTLNQRLIYLVSTILILSFLIGYYLMRRIRKPIAELIDVSKRFQEGDMNARSMNDTKNEFGILSASFNSMLENIQINADLEDKFNNIAQIMLSKEETRKFFKVTLPALCNHTNSQMAAVYLLSEDKKHFVHYESIGMDDSAKIMFSSDSFEGEFGAVIASHKIQYIKKIPIDTRFIFQTVSGKYVPREIVTIPILAGDELIAIISLASIHSFPPQSILLVENILDTLNARVEGILAYRKLKHFSEELEIQREEVAKAGTYNRSLLEANIDPLVTIGADGKITDVNCSTELITGLSRTELIGTDFASYFTEPEMAKKVYLQVFNDGIVRDYELVLRHINGQQTPVLYNATVYRDESGKVSGVFAAARDITEQKRVERELNKLNEEISLRSENLAAANTELQTQKTELASQSAELTEQNTELEMQKNQLNEANRLKTNFLSNMSHELRTPLNSVIALSGVLNRRLAKKIPDEEYSYLEVIERNGKHLLSLINDILDISRIESGREEVEVTKFNADNLISEIASMIHPQAEQKNIELFHIPGDAEIIITSDAQKCRHILQNLIGNAVKFTEKGKVEVTAQQRADNISITVTDTGIGISKTHLSHIFDEFRQADGSTSRRFGGTGLGLAIAKKYANMLGGTITVKSTPDKGSAFTLTLPLYYVAENGIIDEEVTTDFKHAIKQISQTIASTKTILLVEDSEPAVIQIKDFMEESGYQMLVAHDGTEALGIIAQTIPDAMILDLMMPGIDGFEVLKTLREAEPTAHIPVLILTAKHITNEELKFLKRNNVHQLIQKGDVNRTELLNSVATMVCPESMETEKSQRELQTIKGKPVVLIVEDNTDNMITVKAILGDNYILIEAVDGNEGLKMAKKHKPNLILMDIELPGMDGIEAFKAIRKNVQLEHVPVIALTASTMTSDRETILSHGFDAYLAKPIEEKLFFKTINEVLYGK